MRKQHRVSRAILRYHVLCFISIDERPTMPSNRLYAYDVVRVVAMAFVVAVHSLVVVDASSPAIFLVYAVCQATFFTANALFFMLSGKFNLRERKTDEDLKGYYLKRFRGFLLPILILFLIRTLYNLFPNYETVLHVGKEYIKNSLGGFNSMEYWFVFTLFGFLLVAPFIAPMFSKMTGFAKKLFLGIGLSYNLLVLVTSNMGIDFGWGYLFSGFALAFCLGAFVEDLFTTRKARTWLYLCAAGGLAVTVLLAWNGWMKTIHDTSPFYTVLAIGIYIFILSAAKNAKPSKVVSFMAQHSFSVYLVHMMFLLPISRMMPQIDGAASLALYVATTAIVFGLSLLCAIVIDAILVKPAQKAFDWIAGKAASRREAQ